jgi:hypothetical protein
LDIKYNLFSIDGSEIDIEQIRDKVLADFKQVVHSLVDKLLFDIYGNVNEKKIPSNSTPDS